MICGWVQRRGDRTIRAPSTRCSIHMAATPLRAALLFVALALTVTGCNRSSNFDLWPMLTGEPRAKPAVATDQPMQTASQSAAVATAPLDPASSAYPPPSSGTFVGQKA